MQGLIWYGKLLKDREGIGWSTKGILAIAVTYFLSHFGPTSVRSKRNFLEEFLCCLFVPFALLFLTRGKWNLGDDTSILDG